MLKRRLLHDPGTKEVACGGLLARYSSEQIDSLFRDFLNDVNKRLLLRGVSAGRVLAFPPPRRETQQICAVTYLEDRSSRRLLNHVSRVILDFSRRYIRKPQEGGAKSLVNVRRNREQLQPLSYLG